ncbi:MAG: hypothetical protein JNM84_06950 [Planctomycetes bacterium]|nr:hypothetical protein [Planctomycetota bacterium]
MRKNAVWLWWIAASVWAAEPAAAQRVAASVTGSRAGEKVILKTDPLPAGEVDVRVTVIDPSGNRNPLPPKRTTGDPTTGSITGPALPAESRGYFVEVELRDPTTGNRIALTGTWVT